MYREKPEGGESGRSLVNLGLLSAEGGCTASSKAESAPAHSQTSSLRKDSHTYDKAAQKWNNFDVEGALAEVSDDDTQASGRQGTGMQCSWLES